MSDSIVTTAAICKCCRANVWKRHIYTASISYLECLACHYHRQERAGVDELSTQFVAEQRKFYDEDSILLSPTFSTLSSDLTARRVSTVLRHLPRGSSIIEAGPGTGDVILKLAELGYETTAVEHSSVLAKRLSALGGLSVRVGDFADESLPEDAYDAYCSFHVIEHVVDFRRHLDVARRCVRTGGLAFIATPNARGWEQRLPFGLSPNNDSSHFQLFSEQALTRVMEDVGWERIATYTPSYAIAWLRVITKILRRVRGLDEETTGGHFARTTSRKLGVAVGIFSIATRPFRAVQEWLEAGNELFLIARRVR